jgi:hypothetical protein
MTNHYEGHSEISWKHDLFKNLKGMCSELNESVYHITPLTFYVKVVPEKGTYQSIKQGMHQFKQIYSLLEEFKAKFDGVTTPEIQVLRSKKIRSTS